MTQLAVSPPNAERAAQRPRWLTRITNCVKDHYKALSRFRSVRRQFIERYAGPYYSDQSDVGSIIIPEVQQAVDIITRYLVSQNPAVRTTTANQALRAESADFAAVLNRLLPEITFSKHLANAVRNAIFGMGILKVGRTEGRIPRIFRYAMGTAYARSISVDDWVQDVACQHWEDVQFMGNCERVPREDLEADERVDQELLRELPDVDLPVQGIDGDDRVEDLTELGDLSSTLYLDSVAVWYVHIRRENLIVGLPCDGKSLAPRKLDRPFSVIELEKDAPDTFLRLTFMDIPDNVIPLSILATTGDLAELVTNVWRKVEGQARRQKSILGVRGNAERDGALIEEANDGSIIRLDAVDGAKELRFGGPDATMLNFGVMGHQLYSKLMGNLDALGGLGSQSPTLGQDQLISESADKKIQEMQGRVETFTNEVLRAIGWYVWTDPFLEANVTRRLPGIEIPVPVSFAPENRRGQYLDHEIKIEAYSMQSRSPSEELALLSQILSQFVAPYMAGMQAQGVELDVQALLRQVADLTQKHDLDELLTFATAAMTQGPQAGSAPNPAGAIAAAARMRAPAGGGRPTGGGGLLERGIPQQARTSE